MIFLDIDYEEGFPETYKSVSVFRRGSHMWFESGNVVEDFKDAINYIRETYPNDVVMYKSSVDHFVMDAGDEYYWKTVDDVDYIRKDAGDG